VAALLAALPGDMEAEAGPPPASAVARRFPLTWSTPFAQPAPAGLARVRQRDEDGRALFDPQPVYSAPPEVPSWLVPPPEPTQAERDALAALAALPPPRAPARPRAVLNDAQIASIKERLNLTRAQERHWPALEAALKRLAWKRPPASRASSYATTPTVDVDAAELDRFKAAAAPLMQSFSAEQKREVRALIAIVGLEKLLAGF
jgi:hypothetical protein